MLIANPIYDTVFKFLLEDLEIAKCLISNIIGEKIIDLEVQAQERTAFSNYFMLTVYRVDFKAIIQNNSGETKKVLIELQKGKNPFDIIRFRNYLGENYSKTDNIDGIKTPLSIITIYFLGFKLTIPKAILKVGRTYTDVSSGEIIDKKDDFIEKLTHDSYVVQIAHLPTKTKSKLEKILSVFNQKWVKDQNNAWIMYFDENETPDSDLEMIARRLAIAVASEEIREQIVTEETFDDSMKESLRTMAVQLETEKLKNAQKDKALAEEKLKNEQKEKALAEEKLKVEKALAEEKLKIEELLQKIRDLEKRK